MILLYGSDSCPTNAALPKDIYRDICKYFGVDPIHELISVRQE